MMRSYLSRRFCLWLLCLALFALSTGPCLASDKSESSQIVLQLRWLHQFQFAGYYAAVDQGYYRDAGLEVTIRPGGVEIDTVKEVVDGRAQYGVTNSEILLHRLNGDPLVALAAIFQHSPLVLISRKETGISTPQDLIGKTVKMSLTSRDIELHATLHNEGIRLKQLHIVEGGVSYDDYLNPAYDALSAYVTNQTHFLEENNVAFTIIKPSVYGIDFYGDGLFTSEAELRHHPQRVKAFREASLKGWYYAMAHPEEMIDLIIREYHPAANREHLLYEAKAMNSLILPELVEIGHMNPGRWQHIAEVFAEHKMIPADYSLNGFIYDPQPQPNKTWLLLVIAILASVSAGIGLISFFLYTFNKKLQTEINERKRITAQLRESQGIITTYNRQMEQFSLTATAVLSIRDERVIGSTISRAIVEHSDYERVIISLFKDEAPYRDIIGFGGIDEQTIDKLRQIELPKSWYDKVFEQGIRVGRFSFYIPHTMKNILKQEATVYGTGEIPEQHGTWHPEDNLFVRMNNDQGVFIGVISVDNSKSGRQPTDELVRPLEFFSSQISQIIALNREYKKRTQLEAQLRQAQKMEAIGNLAGGIAHDFNNILGVIIGYAEIGLLDTGNDSNANGHFEEIRSAGNRARDIVQQLLSFSRKSLATSRPIRIQSVVEECLNFLRSSIPATVTITRKLSAEEEIINADPTQIYQVIINLCSNAAQSMDNGGELTVTVDHVDAAETSVSPDQYPDSGAFVRLTVSDTGTGIAPEIMPRIFDPYFTTKEIGKGTGIGLAVVNGVVASHKGHILLSSQPKTGSTFTVLFPKIAASPMAESPEAPPHLHGKGQIMFVDDEPALLGIGKRILERCGFSVETYHDPMQALEAFRQQPQHYDLLITDYTMPLMTGDRLAQQVLAINPTLPVILCTGYTDKLSDADAGSCGIRKYLKKPVSTNTLLQTVWNLLATEEKTQGKQ